MDTSLKGLLKRLDELVELYNTDQANAAFKPRMQLYFEARDLPTDEGRIFFERNKLVIQAESYMNNRSNALPPSV